MEDSPQKPRKTRSFVERVAHRTNYVAWDRATRKFVEHISRKLRPNPETTQAAVESMAKNRVFEHLQEAFLAAWQQSLALGR